MGVSVDDAFKEIIRLCTRKATQINNFPIKIVKQSADIFIANNANNANMFYFLCK